MVELQLQEGKEAYAHAPITEAVFEVRFTEMLSLRDMERLRDRFKRHYNKVEDFNDVKVEVSGGRMSTSLNRSGHKLTAPNAVDLILIREQSFATARHAPYEKWENFSTTAFENIELCFSIAGRKTINRIATRFVNRFDIPASEIENSDINEWVAATVALPESLSKAIGPYSLAVNFLHPETGAKALVQSGIVAPALLKHVSILLDIDVYIDEGISNHKDEISRIAPILRKAKNSIFESLITEKLRRRFK
jgi:uncharacterized protein (TIGR04255 family)